MGSILGGGKVSFFIYPHSSPNDYYGSPILMDHHPSKQYIQVFLSVFIKAGNNMAKVWQLGVKMALSDAVDVVVWMVLF